MRPAKRSARSSDDPSNIGSRFEGYTNPEASERKILRNVFELGDAWIRTGDLMRKDEQGYFYFVDRIGDTFRWKGENVATCEVVGSDLRVPRSETRECIWRNRSRRPRAAPVWLRWSPKMNWTWRNSAST